MGIGACGAASGEAPTDSLTTLREVSAPCGGDARAQGSGVGSDSTTADAADASACCCCSWAAARSACCFCISEAGCAHDASATSLDVSVVAGVAPGWSVLV